MKPKKRTSRTQPVRARAKQTRDREPEVPTPQRGHRVRIRLLMVCMIAAFGVVAARLVQLQTDPDMRFGDEDLKLSLIHI